MRIAHRAVHGMLVLAAALATCAPKVATAQKTPPDSSVVVSVQIPADKMTRKIVNQYVTVVPDSVRAGWVIESLAKQMRVPPRELYGAFVAKQRLSSVVWIVVLFMGTLFGAFLLRTGARAVQQCKAWEKWRNENYDYEERRARWRRYPNDGPEPAPSSPEPVRILGSEDTANTLVVIGIMATLLAGGALILRMPGLLSTVIAPEAAALREIGGLFR